MNVKNGLITFDKNENVQLNQYFNSNEFQCQCSNLECKEQTIAEQLLKDLVDLREAFGAPVTITSGFRCHKHQIELAAGGAETAVGTSQHELGNAADIKAVDMTKLFNEAAKIFLAIGTSKRFLHVDLRSDKIRRWPYKN